MVLPHICLPHISCSTQDAFVYLPRRKLQNHSNSFMMHESCHSKSKHTIEATKLPEELMKVPGLQNKQFDAPVIMCVGYVTIGIRGQ